MRIWSLHPKYLDAKGLVALWRETLLAKNVLKEKTKGYRHHPQLKRFRATQFPTHSINQYLSIVYEESEKRGYHFNKEKIDMAFEVLSIPVTRGQMVYEAEHLLKKLFQRDQKRFEELKQIILFEPHPVFHIIDGEIEDWEIVERREEN